MPRVLYESNAQPELVNLKDQFGVRPRKSANKSANNEKDTLRSYIRSDSNKTPRTGQDESGSQEDKEIMMLSLKEQLKREIEKDQQMMYGKANKTAAVNIIQEQYSSLVKPNRKSNQNEKREFMKTRNIEVED